MVSTRKKRQTNKKLLSRLDDFDQDMIIGNAVSERQENVVVNEGTNDRDFTVINSSNNTAVNESVVNVKTLERCFNERIDREMNTIVDTVEDRIQNAILTAIENIVAPKIELAIKSLNASSGRDATSVTANSERGERVGINASFENASENNNTLRVSNVNDETRLNIPDEVSELSVPETRFDRQTQTHHNLNFSAFNWPKLWVTRTTVIWKIVIGNFCSFGGFSWLIREEKDTSRCFIMFHFCRLFNCMYINFFTLSQIDLLKKVLFWLYCVSVAECHKWSSNFELLSFWEN